MNPLQFFYTTVGKQFANPTAMYIELQFESAPTFDYEIATLLYDKKFAFGIRLDDGLYNAFTNVFSYLYGSVADENSNIHPGIRSTDGCGNDIIWTGDFALPIMNNGSDPHDELSTSHIRWSTLEFARDMGFGVMYHGYELPTIDSIELLPSVDDRYTALKLDMTNWLSYVDTKLGIRPLVASPPGGNLEFSSIGPLADLSYRTIFEEKGFWTMCGRTNPYPVGGADIAVPLHPGLPLDTITNDFFTTPNIYPCPYHYTSSVNPVETLDAMKANVTEMAVADGHHSKVFFTHDVRYDAGLVTGSGMSMADFTAFMDWLDTNYGKSGDDSILFTSVQTVLEYLYCRLNTTINVYKNGKTVTLEIISPNIASIRRPALTLKVNSTVPFKAVGIHNIDRFSQNILNTTSGVINIEWSEEYYAAADRFVTIFEGSHLQADKDYAQYLTDNISDLSLKTPLQIRINNVVIISATNWLFDFGNSGIGYPTGAPYNDIKVASTTVVPTGASWNATINSGGSSTNMVLTFSAGFTEENGGSYPAVAGAYGRVANDGYFLDFALRDSFNVANGVPGYITFSGLNDAKLYDFTIISNRASLTRTTKFTAYNSGAFTSNVSVVSRVPALVGDVGYVNGNFDFPGTISNAIPIGGIITLKVEGVGTTGYLNAMKVTEH